MAKHSKYSPSGFERWSSCPGSIQLTEAHPELEPRSSSYADEGTRLHSIAEEYLTKNLPPNALGDWDAVSDYVLHVRDLGKKAGPQGRVIVEQRLSLEQVVPEMFGTGDAIIYDPKESLIHIVDYKSGSGVPVDVIGNSQLKIYALGAMLTFPDLRASSVRATIVQPRCYHPDGPIRSETYSSLELIDFWEDIRVAAEKTKLPKADFNPGKHCRWCPVTAVCPAVRNKANEVARTVFSAIGAEPVQDLSNLSVALKVLPQIEAWIESVKTQAYREACAGRPPTGYKLVEKRAHRKWENEQEVVKVLESRFGISPLEAYDKKLKSPAQIEKLCIPSQRKQLNQFVRVESTGSTLVPVSDPRPEVLVATAQDVFEQIENEEN